MDIDPVIPLIAEADRLDAIWFAAQKSSDREDEEIVDRAMKVAAEIRRTRPRTLAGAIAMLVWENKDDNDSLTNAVIAGLRDLQARGVCQEKTDVIGFGEPEEGGAA